MRAETEGHKRGLAYALVAVVVVAQIFVAAHALVDLPKVDGWAVWNRVMRLLAGEVTWDQYLFLPHGAHLHSVVYLVAWADYHWANGRQLLMTVVSYLATAGCALFVAGRVLAWMEREGISLIVRLSGAVAAAALVTNLADYETLMQPFQVVMSVSRLTYLSLLWYLIKVLRRGSVGAYVAVVAASCLAVTFHGAGHLFAAAFALLHVVFSRRPLMALGAPLPLIVGIAVQKHYSPGGGELGALGILLSSPDMAGAFLKAVCAYFATPINYLWPVVGERTLLSMGFIVFAVTTAFAAYGTVLAFAARLPLGNGRQWNVSDEVAMAWVIAVILALSGAAAAAFWIVRVGAGNAGEAYRSVLASARYGAYASLAWSIFMGVAVLGLARFRAARHAQLGVTLLVTLAAVWPAATLARFYTFDDHLNIAAAALSMGFSPTHPEGEAVWPGVKDDWYWVDALPMTAAFLRIDHKGPWSHLPALHATNGGTVERWPVAAAAVRPVETDRRRATCHLEGRLEGVDPGGVPRSVLAPVVNYGNEVIGYAVLTRASAEGDHRPLKGYVLCADAQRAGPAGLYLTQAQTGWVAAAEGDEGIAPFDLTDATWIQGVARNWPGFFVADVPEARALFVPGTILRFADGQLRVVQRQEVANGYLNVFVTGAILDGGSVGFPHKVAVLN
ncbi:hypothetical protein [Azoarcus olearius]|uniref:hypothetical protein n=1 Tax=Azoarcus sp. (strain BH72) TaxID=418699 RepID=UPI0002FDDF57|nr:hypothetical protein [Azoarcus olearius]